MAAPTFSLGVAGSEEEQVSKLEEPKMVDVKIFGDLIPHLTVVVLRVYRLAASPWIPPQRNASASTVAD